MSAIQTNYAGCRFRSRLEARWAVFFDAAGIRWEYERQGFSLPSGPYLPDFWLPALSAWVEVKGKEATPAELRLLGELETLTGRPAYMLAGDIPRQGDRVPLGVDGHGFEPQSWLGRCERCGAVAVGWSLSGCHRCAGASPVTLRLLRATRRATPIGRCLHAARSARFEHGETPRPPIPYDLAVQAAKR